MGSWKTPPGFLTTTCWANKDPTPDDSTPAEVIAHVGKQAEEPCSLALFGLFYFVVDRYLVILYGNHTLIIQHAVL